MLLRSSIATTQVPAIVPSNQHPLCNSTEAGTGSQTDVLRNLSWGWNMIKSGSTITMEAWDMKYKPNSDWNHAWGAAPANIIPGYMWGIRPTEPGFISAEIQPQLYGLQSSKIIVPTIRGNIKAEYKDEKETKEFIIWIPGNMECDFILTDPENSITNFNDKIFVGRKDRLKLTPGLNKIILR